MYSNLDLMRMKNAADNGRAIVLMLFALNLVVPGGSLFLAVACVVIMGLAYLSDIPMGFSGHILGVVIAWLVMLLTVAVAVLTAISMIAG
jgi:hypothetical protein